MKTKEKLSFRVYVSKSRGGIYPLTGDESQIDLNNPLTGLVLPKYKHVGENNHFHIYELKKQFQ